ncbi:HAD family hydrolase [Dyella choica]|uniref:HAD family hydrolase n=2 Tax=Dyella choica TaxID=1927959 RepID=A0A432M6X6_9GAMM|nr:HAD family hydrolase [Dyella choica]
MNLALFDFDGTITHKETFAPFLRFAIPRRRHVLGSALFPPWVIGYRLGLVSGIRIRSKLVAFGFRGLRAESIAHAGRRFSEEVLPQIVRPSALERIQWHQAQGDKVVVVSGALDIYLKPWCKRHGVELLCSSLHAENGVLSGRYQGLQCVKEEKCRRVRELCDPASFPLVYAYGDTKEDLDMLSMAQRKFYRWQEVN